MESGLQAVDVSNDALVQFAECGAGLAEASIVFGPAAEVRDLRGRQSAQAGLAVLGPRNHGGGMERPLVGGAVAGGFAAARVEFVDGTFDELAPGEQGMELALIVAEQGGERLAQAAGAIRGSGQGTDLLFMLYTIKT